MDKKTLLAVVISVVIIVAGLIIQPMLFPPKQVPLTATQTTAPASPTGTVTTPVQPTQTPAAPERGSRLRRGSRLPPPRQAAPQSL